jgi:hypothetical protein
MFCVIYHIYTLYNQALIIIGSDFAVMNALPLLLSYLRCLHNPQYN